MKKSFLINVLAVFLAGSPLLLIAQTTIPNDVQAAIDELYPNAEEIDWEAVDDEKIIFLLDKNGNNVEISLGEKGQWIQISTYITVDDLPSEAQTYLNKDYQEIDFSSIIKNQTRKDISYLVNFETETEIINLTFDANGKLIEKQVENMDDDE